MHLLSRPCNLFIRKPPHLVPGRCNVSSLAQLILTQERNLSIRTPHDRIMMWYLRDTNASTETIHRLQTWCSRNGWTSSRKIRKLAIPFEYLDVARLALNIKSGHHKTQSRRARKLPTGECWSCRILLHIPSGSLEQIWTSTRPHIYSRDKHDL